MGCESAYESVKELLKSTECQVFPGMESEGVLNAIPKIHLPFNISLERFNVTPMIYQRKQSEEKTSLWVVKDEIYKDTCFRQFEYVDEKCITEKSSMSPDCY